MEDKYKRHRKWVEKTKHPCLDCGKRIYKVSIRCKSCAGRHRGKNKMRMHPPQNHCVDCGAMICSKATRCRSCSSKHSILWGKLKTFGQKGDKHYGWKGGRITCGGYIYIYNPSHPRALKNGYVSEHSLVWEKANGIFLPKGWIVHHLNGFKSDNRPSNLVGLPNRKHCLVLAAKAKRIQELEAILENNQHQLL